MEKNLDELIIKISGYIEKRIETNDVDSAKDISQNTSALADLITAKAQLLRV